MSKKQRSIVEDGLSQVRAQDDAGLERVDQLYSRQENHVGCV